MQDKCFLKKVEKKKIVKNYAFDSKGKVLCEEI